MMQRHVRTWPERYQQAQARRIARGLDLLRPGRAARALIRPAPQLKNSSKQSGRLAA